MRINIICFIFLTVISFCVPLTVLADDITYAGSLVQEGLSLQEAGDIANALKKYERAVEVYRRNEEYESEAEILALMCSLYLWLIVSECG